MSRIQTKSFLASTGFHLLLLLLILLIGPAFHSSNRKSEKSEPRSLIDIVSIKIIDETLSGGGNPNAPPPAPRPPPVRPVQPVELPKQLQRNADAFDINPPKRLPGVSLKPVIRKAEPTSHSRPQTDAADEQRTQLATAFRDATRSLRDSLSSSTFVEMRGWDGRGVPYANFLDSVKRVYSAAWNVPDGVTDDEATATVTVTIARDGTVLSAKIIRRSGNAIADASVEATLRRVTIAVPLPDGAKEDERTVTIKFNVKAKREL